MVNCVGDVVDENGGIVLGGKNSCEARLLQGESPALSLRQNTSLVMITTNADLDHAACLRVARMGSAGLSRSQRPSSTTFDGDIVFAASTGNVKADDMVVGSIAQSLVAKAVLSGVVR